MNTKDKRHVTYLLAIEAEHQLKLAIYMLKDSDIATEHGYEQLRTALNTLTRAIQTKK